MTLTLATLALTTPKADAHHSIRHTVCQQFGPRCARALAIVRCESLFNPKAVGRAGEKGLFQIHPTWFGRRITTRAGTITVNPHQLFNPRHNTRVAYVLSNAGTDWRPWTCSRWR